MNFGKEMLHHRTKMKMKLTTLSERTDIELGKLTDYENDRKLDELSPYELYCIGMILNWEVDCMVDSLLGYEKETVE